MENECDLFPGLWAEVEWVNSKYSLRSLTGVEWGSSRHFLAVGNSSPTIKTV
jgi:hypothetical protein